MPAAPAQSAVRPVHPFTSSPEETTVIADSSSNPSPSEHTLFDRKPAVGLDNPGDVIAAIPYLIGYFPTAHW